MRRKGIALFLVLTILGVLTTMLGAFMTINHSNFSLLASSMEQAEATQACLSGYNYALYRIEHDKSWGKDAFNGIDDAEPSTGTPLDSALSCTLIEPSHLCYNIDGTRMSFEITIVNNLPISSRSGGSPDPDTRPGDMPAIADDALYLRIVGHAGRATRRAEAVLHTAPAFDSAAMSNGDLEIRQGKVTIDSNDSMRNFIKSNGDINLPRINRAGDVRFRHTGDTSPTKRPPYGYAIARNTIRSGSVNLGQDKDALADANRDSQGFLATKTPRKAEILNLDFADIKLPPGTDSSLPPGNYVFTTTKVNIPIAVSYEDSDGNTQNTTKNLRITVPAIVRRNFVDGTVEKVWWSDTDIYIPPNSNVWLPGYPSNTRVTQLGGESLAEYTGASEVITGDPPVAHLADGVDADLYGANVVVQPGHKVNVAGDFGLLYERRSQRGTVEEGPGGIDYPDYDIPDGSKDALLVLGNGADGSSLKATGEVDIRQVTGKGAILARKNLSLNGTLVAEGTGVESGGLALMSEQDVVLKVPNQTFQADTVTDTLRNTMFAGLVYAENNFVVRPLSNDASVTRNLNITGSVVARQGKIVVEGTETVNLTYDPKYLDDIVKDLSQNRIKLERWSFTFR